MARKKSGLVHRLLTIATMLPVWADTAIAATAYFGLHRFAVGETVAVAQSGKIAEFVGGHLIKAFATAGQYVLPFIFLLGATISFFRRKKRERLLNKIKKLGSQKALLDMSWREFEMLVGEIFRQRGFTVTETGGNGPDGGVDLVLNKDHETHLVQCKQWKAFKVGVQVVRELFGVMAAQGAVSGYVVTSGVFTNEARAFADGRNIELIDGAMLTDMILNIPASDWPTEKTSREPTCPQCGSAMVRRSAKHGHNAGHKFFGCSRYPECRGTRPI